MRQPGAAVVGSLAPASVALKFGFCDSRLLKIANIPEAVVHAWRIYYLWRNTPEGHREPHHRAASIRMQQRSVPGDNATPVMTNHGELVVPQSRCNARNVSA